jgi:hypothetical protein
VLFIALAVVVVLGALVWLGLAILRTWRSVMGFGREVAAAGERVASASDALNAAVDTANAGARRPVETA